MLITDPFDFLLDADHDIVITDDILLVSGLQGIAQIAKIRISMFMGENFMDQDSGVPWLPHVTVPESRAILGSKYDEQRCRREIRRAIAGTIGVLSILQLTNTFDSAERNVSIQWTANTVFGETAQTQEVQISE